MTRKRGTIKKRPPDSRLAQQCLPAWEPMISCGTTWPWILPCGLIQIVLGAFLVAHITGGTEELKVPYNDACSNCSNLLHTMNTNNDSLPRQDCECFKTFNVTEKEELKAPVYFYYEITNFYQNHRKFMADRDDVQLTGKIFSNKGKAKTPSKCNDKKEGFRKSENKKFYFPCGSYANAMFTDSFQLKHSDNGKDISVDRGKSILWPDLISRRFKNPDTKSTDTKFTDNFEKPRDWSDSTWKEFWEEGGVQSSRFVNWMLPHPTTEVRKLYGIINKEGQCDGLCMGKYDVSINYRFLPKGYQDGERFLVFSKTNFLGTKKPALSWFLLISGICFMTIGILFFLSAKLLKARVHPWHKRKTHFNDHVMIKEFDDLGPASVSGLTVRGSSESQSDNQWGQ